MASVTDFRRIALALDGVTESAHMGHPDFRGGATLVHLPSVDEDILGETITLSYQNAAAKSAKKKTSNVKRKTKNV